MDKIRTSTVFEAAQRLTNISPVYMKLPIQDGFNWSECFAGIDPGEWYLVAFRSRHHPNIDNELLNEYDGRALDAARAVPGFLTYFVGTPDEQGDCLSFCLWESQLEARAAAAHPSHQAAQQLAYEMYEYFQLERYRVTKVDAGDNVQLAFERL